MLSCSETLINMSSIPHSFVCSYTLEGNVGIRTRLALCAVLQTRVSDRTFCVLLLHTMSLGIFWDTVAWGRWSIQRTIPYYTALALYASSVTKRSLCWNGRQLTVTGVHSTRGEEFDKGVRLLLVTVPTVLKSTRGWSGVTRNTKAECQHKAIQISINYFLWNMGKAEARWDLSQQK